MGGSQPEGVEEVCLLFALGGRSKHLEVGEVRDIFYYRIVKTEPEKNSWTMHIYYGTEYTRNRIIECIEVYRVCTRGLEEKKIEEVVAWRDCR